ncbi:NAD-dependent epimerase/dehydratase family protein [Bradyrhizobium macuxiense]|uniref:NAD-dependent epimerase/dehydratase family protein n=2 Tax=Bradyrhizobium macuxiense TaxID=1755647 RepID=A0A560KZ06_9BRAD|nr:NAD-dependent epimerase/dehydratase family protein [Bradyrhizobium macuxiense]
MCARCATGHVSCCRSQVRSRSWPASCRTFAHCRERSHMILVTGAAGFIGSNIVAVLNDLGRNDIVVCDWLGKDDKWLNLRKRQFAGFVHPERLFAWLDSGKDIEAIVHMGAISATTAVDGDEVIRNNFDYSLQLLDYCTVENMRRRPRSMETATSRVRTIIGVDAIRALRPLNLYGWSKRQFDLVVADRIAKGRPLPPRCTGFRFSTYLDPTNIIKGHEESSCQDIS